MAAFDLDADSTHPADFGLLRGGGLGLYRQRSVLHDAERDLAALGYRLARIDALGLDEASIHDSFSAALGFPGYYGRSLDALADCLYDVAHGDYGWTATATGLAVTLDGFGGFAAEQPDLAILIANVIAGATRAALLFGHRLVWLLQADDGRYRLGSVGCFEAPLKGGEWRDSQRR